MYTCRPPPLSSVDSPGLAQSPDYGPYGFWLQQKTAGSRPAVQPFAHGEHSALRMQGTSSNPLGFMQVGHMNWHDPCFRRVFKVVCFVFFMQVPSSGTLPLASSNYDLLNIGTAHVSLVLFVLIFYLNLFDSVLFF